MKQTRCQSFAHHPSRLNASDSRPLSAFLLPHSGESHCETAPSCQTPSGSSRCSLPGQVDTRWETAQKSLSCANAKASVLPVANPGGPCDSAFAQPSIPFAQFAQLPWMALPFAAASCHPIAVCRRQLPFYCHLPPSAAAFWARF